MRALLLLSVVAACSRYAQHRAALVPHAAALPWNGQPLATTGELDVGASNLADHVAPRAGNPDDGDSVPSTQLRGELAMRARDNWRFAAVHERGLVGTETQLTSSQPPLLGHDVTGYGGELAYSIATAAPEWRIGVAAELLIWSVPWVEYTTCVAACGTQVYTSTRTGSDLVPTFALAFVPSYHAGRWTLFGGLTLRNHPTAPATSLGTGPNTDDIVNAGPLNVIVHAGAEVALGGVRASVVVDQDTTTDPVRYGPGIGVMVAIPLGSEPRPASEPASGPPGLAAPR
ncbi:MAG: hypothetical protein ACM31C_22560 [Acidobacteriota bacterium]